MTSEMSNGEWNALNETVSLCLKEFLEGDQSVDDLSLWINIL